MLIDFIDEPELEFFEGRHVDIRFGVTLYGPLDFGTPHAPTTIRIGIVGTPPTVEGLTTWLQRCKDPIAAKSSDRPNLFTGFPGFSAGTGYRSTLALSPRFNRELRERDVDEALADQARGVDAAVGLFLTEIEDLLAKGRPDVVVVAPPMSIALLTGPSDAERNGYDSQATTGQPDFHDLLKARAMRFGVPIQIVLPMTYDVTKRLPRQKAGAVRQLQDDATRAWNLHTALYYKANGTPWRMKREPTDLATCYVGISFYRTLDGSSLLTSSAQVFNERGEGMILRGGNASLSKDDRQVHLTETDSYELMRRALLLYRSEHKTSPARLVIHKTSSFNEAEIAGFEAAVNEERVDGRDFVHVRTSGTRLCRVGPYPPLRGTVLRVESAAILYTRGSVEFFSTYPGMYVPRPIELRFQRTDQSMELVTREVLALTKMNWNNTQFDGGFPITIRAARKVGEILRYLSPGEQVEPRYSYYM